ncbi:13981_t:CDS:2 [Funneliformis caledonium]|uniref:13981_t:CDS:1 n=1 Tax=Funneliformis caledonium TaxID=1117310 RepID=A0A9N9BJF0_9GLOM|nr:13981_t:CDS:2 [Funneliformis caledonium]
MKDDIKIVVEQIKDDKPYKGSPKADKPHKGSPITIIEISPNAKCIVTYSEEDKTIVGWNVEDEEDKLKPDCTINSDKIFRVKKTEEFDEEDKKKIFHMCVSDKKKLVLSYVEYGSHIEGNVHDYLRLIDMKNQNQMELYFKFGIDQFYCNFNSKEEFILYSIHENTLDDPFFDKSVSLLSNQKYSTSIIWIYSTQTAKWKCKKIYEVPQGAEMIGISKHDRIQFRLNNNIYKWSIINDKILSKISKSLSGIKTKDIKMSSNQGFIYLKINDEITVYSTEPVTPIVSFDLKVENHDKIYNFIKKDAGLHCLLLSLFDYNSINKLRDTINKYCRKLCPDNTIEILPNIPSLLYDYQSKKYIFGVIDGYVWKIKFDELEFDEIKLDINHNLLKEFEDDEVTESWNAYFGIEKDNSEYEGSFLSHNNNNKSNLLQEETNKYELKGIKLEIYTINEMIGFIGLRVFRNDKTIEEFINIKYKKEIKLYKVEIFHSKEIIILTNVGIFIFHLNDDDDLILNHFFFCLNEERQLAYYIDESFWVSLGENDRYKFLKYGVKLINAIKEHDIESVDDIYKKCLDCFKQDLANNKAFLSIITYSMSLLNQYYPEYIIKYLCDTDMIIDSLDYDIGRLNTSHLYPYEGFKLVNLTRSIPWTKYNFFLKRIVNKSYGKLLLNIEYIISINILPFTYLIYNALDHFNIINNIMIYERAAYVYYRLFCSSKPTITFMLPYYKFVNYPEKYNMLNELFQPQHSPFTITRTSEICKTWGGEALINFKWNTYGKYYFAMIWMGFNVLFGCFTAGAILSEDYIETRDNYTKNEDQNNPWNIASSYNQILEDGSISTNPFIIQKPNENTNMFADFRTALFAIFLTLSGDLGTLGNWSYKKNSYFVFLLTLFVSIVVIYLLNLLIGLLNNAIDEDNNRNSYLMHKAEILKEIELFYLLPYQRRKKTWFPDVIYYHADVDETRKKVNDLIKKGEWDPDKLEFSAMKKNLLKKLNIKYDP